MSPRAIIGQYVPGDSAVHRLDARAKIGVAAALTVALFVVSEWWALAAVAVLAIVAIAISKVPLALIARGVRPILFLLLFTIAINALFPTRASEALLELGPLTVDLAGLTRGLFFGTRILVLILGTSLVTLTTSPVALTDALAQMMRPFARTGFPVEDTAMMMSVALRFMPTTAEEAERIVVAQTARGARFDSGGPVTRARAWLPVLVPLFVRLFRRADDLAIAMESRCYRGTGRTRLREPVMRVADWAVLAVALTLALALAVFGRTW